MKKKLTHGSTFSGIGAPEIAAEMLGWDNAFHCEINPFGRQILEYYFPNSTSYEDITNTNFEQWRGRIDVLTGGFPCQPFSYAGKRRGAEDDRYLWPYMLRCIEQVRPTWFIGENVGGITTMVIPGENVKVGDTTDLFDPCPIYRNEGHYVLDEICGNLERIGYSVQPLIIPACAVGAPHRRDRIFIIAHDERGIADNSACGAGTIPSAEGTERVQERYEIRETFVASNVRPEIRGVVTNAANMQRDGCVVGQCGGRQEVPEFRNDSRASVIADATGEQGRRGIERKHSKSRQVKFRGRGGQNLLPSKRWKSFPSVAPVYRGNDGLPFNVDDLSIPFSKWKKESLKAYGNAIVVQVMYEIFRAIDIIENETQTN